MILLAEIEGPDQTARMRRLMRGLRWPHMAEEPLSHREAQIRL